MAKKLWVGLGVGCGGLLLLVIIGLVAGSYWLKNKFGGLAKSAEQMKAQKAQLSALEEKYPFAPPADGTLVLEEPRLQDYLAIREDVLAAFQKFEAHTDELKQRKDKQSLSEGMAAAQTLTLLGLDVEQRYINGLDQHHMSPDEFQALSNVLFAEPDPKSPNAALLTRYQAKIEPLRNPGLDGLLESGNIGQVLRKSAGSAR